MRRLVKRTLATYDLRIDPFPFLGLLNRLEFALQVPQLFAEARADCLGNRNAWRRNAFGGPLSVGVVRIRAEQNNEERDDRKFHKPIPSMV